MLQVGGDPGEGDVSRSQCSDRSMWNMYDWAAGILFQGVPVLLYKRGDRENSTQWFRVISYQGAFYLSQSEKGFRCKSSHPVSLGAATAAVFDGVNQTVGSIHEQDVQRFANSLENIVWTTFTRRFTHNDTMAVVHPVVRQGILNHLLANTKHRLIRQTTVAESPEYAGLATNVSRFAETFDTRVPGQSVAIPVFGGSNMEVFTMPLGVDVVREQREDVYELRTRDYSFVRVVHDEAKYGGLQRAAFEAYKKIFDRLDRSPGMNFLRAWNYIPHILKVEGRERYREFNLGRWEAWEAFGPKRKDGMPKRPAATAIGSFDGPLIIEAIFSRYDVVSIENPRQKPFEEYSRKWGPKPPVSARGTLHLHSGGPEIWVAGTASLLGEEVAHEGDVEEQTRETLRNIEALISQPLLRLFDPQASFQLENFTGVRVYIKNREDFARVKGVVEQTLKTADVIYLHDDICRPGFLVEIEGIAR